MSLQASSIASEAEVGLEEEEIFGLTVNHILLRLLYFLFFRLNFGNKNFFRFVSHIVCKIRMKHG